MAYIDYKAKLKPMERAFVQMRNLEALAIQKMEKRLLKKKRNAIYIALEDLELDWYWADSEVKCFDCLWKIGVSVPKMAEIFNRKPLEVTLLMLDRLEKREIKKREGGFWGG